MATVKKNTPPPVPPPTYSIELSEEEAQSLTTLLHGGVGHNTLKLLKLEELHLALVAVATPRTDFFRSIANY